AGDTRVTDVRGPGAVDLACHLQHAQRYGLGVKRVGCEVLAVLVAVGAALLRRYPFGDGQHQTDEVVGVHVAQHLDILVDFRGLLAAGRRARRRVGNLVEGTPDCEVARIEDLDHAGTAVAALHTFHGRSLEGQRQADAECRDDGDRHSEPEVHRGAPTVNAG